MIDSAKLRLPIAFALALHLLVLVRTAWVHEDAFITLRTVRNLLDGFGPVWNVGERVQSYTHPLWMFTLAGFIGISGEFYYTVISLCLIISAVVALLIALRHADSLTAAILALLLLSLSKAYTDYATSGLENPLTHLLLALFLLLYFRPSYSKNTLLLATGIAALGMMNRMDIAVIYLPMLLYMWSQVGWRAGFGAVALGSLPFVLWELFALFYYGFPFPNTAYAKLNTGIPQIEYVQKGLLYFIHTTGVDPLTSAAIVIGIVLALINHRWRARWLAVGMLFYLVYLLYIGGDYMVGRFLTAPFVVAVIYLTHAAKELHGRVAVTAVMLLVIMIGLMSPRQTPLFADDAYNLRRQNSEGIADERSWYNLPLGLLTTDRHNRVYESGAIQGDVEPGNRVAKGIGRAGFRASTYTYIIDLVGLADPLLARLPARYNPNWRSGHPLRVAPAGYETAVHTGENTLLDPQLAEYYDKLQIVVRGDLWRWSRLREIARLNLGRYDHLIDVARYRYPERQMRSLAEVERSLAASAILPPPLPINQDGVLIDLGGVHHNQELLVGLNLDRFTIIFFRDGEEIGQQPVRAQVLQLGDQDYHAVTVADEFVDTGYTSIHIRPDLLGEYDLTYVDILADDPAVALHPEQLSELYAYTFHRAPRVLRARRLEALMAQLRTVTPQQWHGVPTSKLLDLLKLPDPDFNEIVLNNLPDAKVLTDGDGHSVVRYLGHESTPSARAAESAGLEFKLLFEALDRLDEEYVLWFHIKAVDSDREWMIYDYEFETPVTDWAPTGIYAFEKLIELEPGRYDITAGLWTAARERLYVDKDFDIYWIELGEHELPAP